MGNFFLQNIEKINSIDILIFVTIAFFVGILFAILVKGILDRNNDTEFIKFVLYILWISAGTFILIIVYNMLDVVAYFDINVKKYPLVAAVGIMLSAFIASASVLRNIHNTNIIEKNKKIQESSKFYLDKSLEELNNVYELLKDKNNDRVTWVLSARVLLMALELSKNITDINHKRVYYLQEFQLKHKLLDLFSKEEYKKLSFYAGLNSPLNKKDVVAITEIVQTSTPNIKKLSMSSLFTIFSFIEYPDKYADPLDEISTPENEDEFDLWLKKGHIRDKKDLIKTYYEVTIDKDGQYKKIAYENTIF